MSNRNVFVLAAAVAFAAWLATPMSMAVVVITSIVALVVRKSVAVITAAACAACALSSIAWTHLDAPVPSEINGTATIVRDSESVFHATVAEVKVDGRHYQLWARGSSAETLSSMSSGQKAHLRGYTRALSGKTTASSRRRHIAANLDAVSLTFESDGNAFVRFSNGFRAVIERGARPAMSKTEAALLTGLVYGDDSEQSDEMQKAFQDSGLAHLTAVSGANVAFVLLLVTPLLQRLSLSGRFVGGLAILFLFGTITRWEPSVVRAEVMAAVVLFGIFIGRPVPMFRNLCLGATAAILLDPFLVGSVGFILSMAACTGMALLGERLSVLVGGPMVLRRIVGYSAAAQVGVLPVSIVVFGSMPMVGLITNLLVEPTAGAVMMWGLGAGLTAGLLGEHLAGILHVPTRLMLWWIHSVARQGAEANGSSVLRWLSLLGPVGAVAWWRLSSVPGRISVDKRE